MVITQREHHLKTWLETLFKHQAYELLPLAADASFRRYYRLRIAEHSYVVMDAPPDREDCQPFIAIATGLSNHKINTPLIHHYDLENGFLLISDLGDDIYLTKLKELDDSHCNILYQDAIDTLIQLQTCHHIPGHQLTIFDYAFIMMELERFEDWFIRQLLNVKFTTSQQHLLANTYALLCDNVTQQPRVIIHRDYHSRNLILTASNSPGVLDFQDAMLGPISYDLVSLLRDCYIAWPQPKITNWIAYYLLKAHEHKIIDASITNAQFTRWFDLMGIQRHLKAIGIFARLKLRDNKAAYLQDIPCTLNYVINVAAKYPEFIEFSQLLQQHVAPYFSIAALL